MLIRVTEYQKKGLPIKMGHGGVVEALCPGPPVVRIPL